MFLTADTHFGHANILKHQPQRRFATVDEMDAALIDRINATVGQGELWVLGDFAWKASRYGHYRARIKARELHIIAGNHDAPSLAQYVSSYADAAYRKFGEYKVHLSHYPHASWRGRTHGSIHLYGHSHGSLEAVLDSIWPGRRAMDVGVDNAHLLLGAFRPFSFDEILTLLAVV